MKTKYHPYVNDVPRYGLGIVFLLFGIDKFLIHDFYVSWFTATERITVILPLQDIGLSIYLIGVVELVFAALLFAGIGIRWVAIVVSAWMVVILSTARYPSSFPQDIGLLGISFLLIITGVSWKGAQIEKFLRYLRVVRYPISAVLVIWAVDHATNYERHVGWIQLSSRIGYGLSANEAITFIIVLTVIELALAGLIASGRITVTKYSLIAVAVFFVFARFALAPPLNNHQSIGMAFATAWLALVAYKENKV